LKIRENIVQTLLEQKYYGYLRISDGCNNRCSYCSIPNIRGEHKSEAIDDLLIQCQHLASQGVQELIINAQDTSMYGVDNYEKPMLIELLKRIELLGVFKWLRLLYLHPAHFDERMITELSQIKSLVPYFDIPLQHISDDILNKMNRKINKKTIIKRLVYLRAVFPDCALRTTFITGFPGETRGNFQELLSFVEEFKFTRLGVFTYSKEEGTPVYHFTNQVSKQTANRRRDRLLSVQTEISEQILSSYVGKTLDVLIESDDSGRSFLDAPEIDGTVFVNTKNKMGQIIKVKITGSSHYDLVGEVFF
jgi:ribosomal protein S12 methylthiotransferase